MHLPEPKFWRLSCPGSALDMKREYRMAAGRVVIALGASYSSVFVPPVDQLERLLGGCHRDADVGTLGRGFRITLWATLCGVLGEAWVTAKNTPSLWRSRTCIRYHRLIS